MAPSPFAPSSLAVKMQHEQMANINVTMEGRVAVVPSTPLTNRYPPNRLPAVTQRSHMDRFV